MEHRTVTSGSLSVLLLLFHMALAQDVQVDLVFERVLPSQTGAVGIEYDDRGRPIFAIQSEDRVEVMDDQGKIVRRIASCLKKSERVAGISENGRFTGIMRCCYRRHRPSGLGGLDCSFALKRRNGRTVYRLRHCGFNRFDIANNGAVSAVCQFGISHFGKWSYYDPTGKRTRDFPKGWPQFFGDDGCYIFHDSGRHRLTAYNGDHVALWSTDRSSSQIGRSKRGVSADGRYFVRYGEKAAQFYRDGRLVHTDTTMVADWVWPYHSRPKVIMTPDNHRVLLIPATGYQAYLWDLEENRLVRIYERPHGLLIFQEAACSAEAEWVMFHTYMQLVSGSLKHFIMLYNRDAEAVWKAEAMPDWRWTSWLQPDRWFGIDPSGTYIHQRSSDRLWLYKRR